MPLDDLLLRPNLFFNTNSNINSFINNRQLIDNGKLSNYLILR